MSAVVFLWFPPASWWTFDCSSEGSSMIHLRAVSGHMTKVLEVPVTNDFRSGC